MPIVIVIIVSVVSFLSSLTFAWKQLSCRLYLSLFSNIRSVHALLLSQISVFLYTVSDVKSVKKAIQNNQMISKSFLFKVFIVVKYI